MFETHNNDSAPLLTTSLIGFDSVNAYGLGNVITAKSGNNNIYAGEGNNTITTGAGNDIINVGSGRNIINAGDGSNQIYAGGEVNLVTSGKGNDLIFTGAGNDFINAGDGRNTIFSGDGNNRILSGQGDDVIYAGAGNDEIYSGTGNDTIYAGNGNNVINAGTGNDTVYLGSGTDKIILEGGKGSVTVMGFDIKSDKLRLGESLSGKSLKFVTQGSNSLVMSGTDLLATLKNVAKGTQALVDNGPLYRYQAIDLGSLSADSNGAVVAISINDFGQIAGRYDTDATFTIGTTVQNTRQGFVWENGVQTALTSTGVKIGQSTLGSADGATVTLLRPNISTISNSGVIVGIADEGFNAQNPQELDIDRALVWQKQGSNYNLTINDFSGPTGLESYFFDTNNTNQNAGRQIFNTQYIEPIYWENGVVTGLPTLGGNGGTARGINNKGQLVGSVDTDGKIDTNRSAINTAALWQKDNQGVYKLTDFGTFGAEQAVLRDINDAGQIIGSTSSGSGANATSTPFVLREGEFTALGSLGGKTGSVNGINEFGQVVGASQIASGTNHAYVWIGGVLADLNNLVSNPLTYNQLGVTLTNAASVNNFGDIVATGTYTYKDSAGKTQTGTRSYLLKASL